MKLPAGANAGRWWQCLNCIILIMLDYIIKNKEWIFSGIGVLILSIIYSLISRKQKKEKSDSVNSVRVDDSHLENSPVNSIKGENVNFTQTIINKTTDEIPEESKPIPILPSPEMEIAKKDFIAEKTKLRTVIYKVLASNKTQEFETKVEIRHICDYVEELIHVNNHNVTISELRQMEKEGLVKFIFRKEEVYLGPYTRVATTKKFYDTI